MTATDVNTEFEKFEKRYGAIKTFRFAVAGILGFGVTEVVLTIGLLLLYGKLGIPHESFSSFGLLILDILSLVVGVSTSFVINERITVNIPKATDARASRFHRFMKFQAVSGVGNAGIIAIQLFLLAALEISPLLGSIIGAIVTYPIVYTVSIHFVWKGHPLR